MSRIGQRLRGWSRPERGQTMVEFALVLPVFVILLTGIVDLGRGFHEYAELTNGVREGARAATFDQNTTNIKNVVIARTYLGLTASDITVTCYAGFTATTKTCGSTLDLGDAVKVSATKTFYPITGQIISLLGSSINISSSAQRGIQ